MFRTQGSGSFTAHQDLIAGGTTIDKTNEKTDVDFPSRTAVGMRRAIGDDDLAARSERVGI